MHDFCFTIPYGLILIGGGIVGFAKKGSTASLAGGVGTGLLLLLAGYLSLKAFEKKKNSYFAIVIETGNFRFLFWLFWFSFFLCWVFFLQIQGGNFVRESFGFDLYWSSLLMCVIVRVKIFFLWKIVALFGNSIVGWGTSKWMLSNLASRLCFDHINWK